MATSGERWASGSYGPLRAIRLPSLMVGGAKSKSSHFPAGAVDVFKVSCFLRGSMAPYPKRLKQGTLRITGGMVDWSPSFGGKKLALIPASRFKRSTLVPQMIVNRT